MEAEMQGLRKQLADLRSIQPSITETAESTRIDEESERAAQLAREMDVYWSAHAVYVVDLSAWEVLNADVEELKSSEVPSSNLTIQN